VNIVLSEILSKEKEEQILLEIMEEEGVSITNNR